MTPKLERTIALLEEAFLSGRKVLIFAIFNRCGDLIREAGRNLPAALWGAINGSTPQEERQRIVDAFTDYAGPACLVLNPKAAGAGLNITAATIVIHFTQAWNPALEAQASARAHRRGQKEPVTIYRLFYEDTVERVMIDRSEWRRDLGNDAVPISTREQSDLKRALSIRPEPTDD
jgi:SNF2 family DNA or RNA helicase